jgi:hypothetical protein
MKVGDLICDKMYPPPHHCELALIIEVRPPQRTGHPYVVLTPKGLIQHFGREYIETKCEVVSEAR